MRIQKNTGAGAVEVSDSGNTKVIATWTWTLGHAFQESGERRVHIQVGSENLVPKVSFERVVEGRWLPFAAYAPGDLAVFDRQGRRRW